MAAASLLLIPLAAQAAGFGALHVRSSLGQPLQAEIDLIGVTDEEAQSLGIQLAASEAYQRAGLTYNPVVSTLRAVLARQPDGSHVVQVSSSQPIAEPFIDILVDLTWAAGHVSRAYTFLLDPVESSSAAQDFAPTPVVQATVPAAAEPGPASAVAAAPAAVAAPAVAAEPPPQSPAQPVPQAVRPSAAPADAAADGPYTVQRGDTLYSLASVAAQDQEDVSLDQMLLALYRNNPNAFIGGNINRVRAGSVLKMPSQADAQKVPARRAHREVVARVFGFAGYRKRLATAAETAAATAGGDSARQQHGRVSARVQDRSVPAAGSRDELRLSKAGRGDRDAVTALNEQLVAKQHALKEMEARVVQLEKNLSDMRRLAELQHAKQRREAASAMPAASSPAAASAPAAHPSGLTVGALAQSPASASVPQAASASVPQAASASAIIEASAVAASKAPDLMQLIKRELLRDPTTLGLGSGVITLLMAGLAAYFYRRKQLRQADLQNNPLARKGAKTAAGRRQGGGLALAEAPLADGAAPADGKAAVTVEPVANPGDPSSAGLPRQTPQLASLDLPLESFPAPATDAASAAPPEADTAPQEPAAPGAGQPASPPPMQMDLSSDPEPPSTGGAQAKPGAASSDAGSPDAAKAGAEGANDWQVKFDLAKAYIEVGDKDGARELLQEILDRGDAALQTEVQTLMRQIV